jgi:N-acetyl-gamma-glutamyl-phosphate reductase
MIKVGIIGSAGYTAGELLRILLNHPKVTISFSQSSSQAEKPVSSIHSDLVGETDLVFVKDPFWDIDVIFLCQGHGKSKQFLDTHSIPDHIKIIDLSADYRLNNEDHGFVYGLPELNRESIKQSTKLANPGCFATCIELALIPLSEKKLIKDDVHIHAITGSTGAGVGLSTTSHFSWRNNNISIYKPFTHQHLAEIKQSLKIGQPNLTHLLNFIPVRGNFTRGIFASMYTSFEGTLEEAKQLYCDFYKNSPFTHLVNENPHLKQVVNSNKCLIHLELHEGKLLIVSMIDNLVKGASGQAVQNMNLMFGIDESLGLKFKGTGF